MNCIYTALSAREDSMVLVGIGVGVGVGAAIDVAVDVLVLVFDGICIALSEGKFGGVGIEVHVGVVVGVDVDVKPSSSTKFLNLSLLSIILGEWKGHNPFTLSLQLSFLLRYLDSLHSLHSSLLDCLSTLKHVQCIVYVSCNQTAKPQSGSAS